MRVLRNTMLLLIAAVALGLCGCSDAGLCDTCENDRDCEDDLYCAQFEDGSWRCVDSIWTTCETKSFITAP
ncbi:hypothetical protein GF314_10610 [bacterium]|nr:hypothetical protein [bacterium]